jgi:hypothetical protein
MMTPAVADLAFEEGTDYLSVPAGSYDIAIAPAGTSASDAVWSVDDLALGEDTWYTAAAFGTVGKLQVAALVDDDSMIPSGFTRLQVTHAAINVPQVDIWDLDSGTLLVDDFDFGATGTLDVPAGEYTLGFDIDEDGNEELSFAVPNLGGDTQVNVFAVGDGDAVFLLAQLPSSDLAQVDPRAAALRVLHLSPDAPAVDIYLDNQPTPAVTDLAFSEGTAYVELWAGSYDIAITAAGAPADQAVLEIPGLMLDGDRAYTAVAFDYIEKLGALALEDDKDMIPAGYTRLQVTHAAPDVPQVDIWDMDAGVMLVDDFDFGATGTLDVPASAYNLGFDVDDNGTAEVTFSVPNLGGDTQVNVFAVNDDSGVFLLAQLEDGNIARVNAD